MLGILPCLLTKQKAIIRKQRNISANLLNPSTAIAMTH